MASSRKRTSSKRAEAVTTARSSGPRAVRVRGYPGSIPRQLAARLNRLRLRPEELAWRCSPKVFDFRNTREVSPLRGFFGQEQALKSLRTGLAMAGPGYNLYVCGLAGAESTAELVDYIRRQRGGTTPPPDRCYVQNFRDPLRPRLLTLPPGRGAKLRASIRRLVSDLHRGLESKDERKRRSIAREIIRPAMDELLAEFPDREVTSYLRDWQRNLLANIHDAVIDDFDVNLLERPSRGAVVFEPTPTAARLFGWIGRRPTAGDGGSAYHFMEIHGGSLLAADGGVLVVNVADFQPTSSVWAGLKSTLKYGQLSFEDAEGGGAARSGGLHPDPIPLSTKVVMIGDYSLYDYLFECESDFRDIFKFRVDFDTEVPLTARVIKRHYPAFIARTCAENDLRPVSAEGVARTLEFGVRRAGRQSKVTTQPWVIADLLREANYWAGLERRRVIQGPDIDRAVREAVLRLNLVETKISEMINEGTILITTSGFRVGQVNGLAIYDMGDYLFAKPSRITAETSVGQSGIINIEREAGFSGRSHDKGVHILAGYLRSRFAQKRPLSLTASVCFEQSYSGIDGDSASATEICAILSSLSGAPIRQDVAVTGSLNQKGDVQPIGGVNEKIEGFYDCVCALGRPRGTEGVIVPRKNARELALRDDVVRAVARGRFHVYAVETIDEAVEILTGIASGRKRRDGSHTPESVFDRADRRLEEIAQGLRRYSDGD